MVREGVVGDRSDGVDQRRDLDGVVAVGVERVVSDGEVGRVGRRNSEVARLELHGGQSVSDECAVVHERRRDATVVAHVDAVTLVVDKLCLDVRVNQSINQLINQSINQSRMNF